jgi:hypothetical protein
MELPALLAPMGRLGAILRTVALALMVLIGMENLV